MSNIDNLMVVVRTSFGCNKIEPGLIPSGKQTFQTNDGQTHVVEFPHFEYLGDTHIRFVFDDVNMMKGVSMGEFNSFGFSPEEALDRALNNIHREYGDVRVGKMESGIYRVQGDSSDFNSSYFLDKALWDSISTDLKSPIIAAVPARDLVVFAPLADDSPVQMLSESAPKIFEEAQDQQVSSALYRFEDGQWSVYQNPVGK